MSFNKIIYTAALSIILLSCKKEAVLKPEQISPMYTLPQGNHAYDTRIVDFYNKNGTYILYKFNSNDFRWNITNHIPYMAEEADENWVEPSLNFLDDQLFSFYNPAVLKQILPYKIILASKIRALVPSENELIPDPLDIPVMSTYAYSHLAFGNCNSQLPLMTAIEIQKAKSQLHTSLWSSAIQGERIELPPVFISATNYANVYPFNVAQHGVFFQENGFFTLVQDMLDYVNLITSNTKTELESTLFIPEKDPLGRFRFKYNAIIEYYKTNYQIDLQAIGGY